MRFDRLTTKFQTAISEAQALALKNDNVYIEPSHLLLAMLNEENSTIASILAKIGVNTVPLKQELTNIITKLPNVSGTGGEINISRDLNNLLNVTEKIALKLQDTYVASELFLLACLEDKGAVGQLFKQYNLKIADVNKVIMDIRGGQTVQKLRD